MNKEIKNKLQRGLALTAKESQDLYKYIKALEQEQKTGHWIEKEGWDGDLYYECSMCGEPFCLIDGTPTDNMYNFCPNCGSKMVEVEK